MVAAKPDCTGQMFGNLICLGRAEESQRRETPNGRRKYTLTRLWELQCSCGTKLKMTRDAFDKKWGRKSCGCKKQRWHPSLIRKPEDLTGQRFGSLVVLRTIAGSGKIRSSSECICDCKTKCTYTNQQLKRSKYLNCRGLQHTIGKWYPPTPTPYPVRAGQILAMFVDDISWSNGNRIKSDIEDARMEAALRTAWIIAYRESIGEEFTLKRIRDHMRKALKYCALTRKENYNRDTFKIGGSMDLIIEVEAVAKAKTQPSDLMSTRKRKFARC